MSKSLLKSHRNYETFFKVKLAAKAEVTRKQYGYALMDFEKYVKETHDFDLEQAVKEFKKTDVDTIIDTLQGWINKSKIETRNKKARACCVNNYLYYRGVKIDTRDMRDLEYENGAPQDRKGLTIEDMQSILSHCKPQRKALYLAMLSSGMPIEEACSIRKSDLDLSGKRIKITIKPAYTKKKARGRTTFISKEAARALKPFLKNKEANDYVFHNSNDPKVTKENEMQSLRRTVDVLGLGKRYDSGVREITSHCFRAYFFTKAVQVHGENYAHKMTGHKGHLMEYDRYDDQKKLDMYLALEPQLLIFEQPVDSQEVVTLTKKNQELEAKIGRMGEMLAELYLERNPDAIT